MPSLPIRGHRRGQSLGAFKKETSVAKFNIEEILAFDKDPSSTSQQQQQQQTSTVSTPKISNSIDEVDEKPTPTSSPQKPPLPNKPKPQAQDTITTSTLSGQKQPPIKSTSNNATTTTASPSHPLLQKFNDQEIISISQQLLNAIASGDFPTYKELCSADMTAFEPESKGMLIQGLGFHKYYFDLFGKPSKPVNVTISNPHVRWIGSEGNAAVISYIRLDQVVVDGGPVTRTMSETRVWEKEGGSGKWVNVHFHKS